MSGAVPAHRGGDDGATDDAEDYEPTDPHPDTPDDFDEDASSPRQSEEALPENDD